MDIYLTGVEFFLNNNCKIFDYLKGIEYQVYLITTEGLIPTNTPLPICEKASNRTMQKNRYFSKKDTNTIQDLSKSALGRLYNS